MTIKRITRFVPGVLILLSVALAWTGDLRWLAIAAFVGINLLQSSLTGWCLLDSILTRLGIPEGCSESSERASALGS